MTIHISVGMAIFIAFAFLFMVFINALAVWLLYERIKHIENTPKVGRPNSRLDYYPQSGRK